MEKTDLSKQDQLFSSPFSPGYWKAAFSEIKKPRMLAVAAMIIALRVILKSVQVPILPGVLYITFGFFANALGSMIYGPVLGLLGGAISDTIGAFVFPTGDYFFPFIITEMVSSLIFGLVLYRCKPSVSRIIISRFAVIVICNIILTPVIMRWYYAYFNIEKTYKLFTLTRTIKNAALFPAEAILLVLFLRALLPETNRMKLTFSGEKKLKITKEHIVILVCTTIVAAVMIWMYYIYYIMK